MAQRWFFIPEPAAGGTTYSVSITDSATATDALTSSAVLGASLSDTATASDTPSSIATLGASLTDSATATDVPSSAATLPASLSDSVTATDAITQSGFGTYNDSISDSATATDSTSSSAVLVAALSDTATATDALDATGGSTVVVQQTGGGTNRHRRRKLIVDGQLYEVPERDIPALLEAVMLQRKPPSTAEVVEQAPAPRKPAPKAQKQPAKARETEQWVQPTVDDAKARYDAMMAELNAQAQVDVARMMQRVAHRVIEDLIDEEEAAIALLMH